MNADQSAVETGFLIARCRTSATIYDRKRLSLIRVHRLLKAYASATYPVCVCTKRSISFFYKTILFRFYSLEKFVTAFDRGIMVH